MAGATLNHFASGVDATVALITYALVEPLGNVTVTFALPGIVALPTW